MVRMVKIELKADLSGAQIAARSAWLYCCRGRIGDMGIHGLCVIKSCGSRAGSAAETKDNHCRQKSLPNGMVRPVKQTNGERCQRRICLTI